MKSLSYLNKYFIKYRWRLILGIIFIAVNNYFGAKMPVLLNDATNSLFNAKPSDGQANTVLIIALTFVAYSLISGFFLFLTRQTIIIMSRHIEFDLKNEIYHKYQQLHYGFYKSQRTGDLMNRISEDVSQVRQYLGPGIMYTVNLVIMFPFVAYQMFKLNAELALYTLIPLPIMTVLIYFVSKRMNRLSKEVRQEQSTLYTIGQETFSGMRMIKAYLQERHVVNKFTKSADNYRTRQMKLVKTNALFMPTIMLLIGTSTMISIYIGGVLVMKQQLEPGIIVAYMMFVYRLTWPFASVGWVTSIIQSAAASQTRINEFLKTEPKVVDSSEVSFTEFRSLQFKNVDFRYRDDLPMALTNIDFTLEKGKTLGIVGRTGSGKSSILHVLLRQVDPSSGVVLVNNANLTAINLEQFRNLTSVVPQDVFLFSDTIKNNILFGAIDNSVSQEELERAAKDAHVLHNIVDFPDKFETILGERGVNLSGGQKQRVSIARALIRKPQLLVLDDCLSAVDTETEEIILGNLDNYTRDYGTSMVIVSHRISSIRNADWILVIEDGKIVEQGTQETLLQQKGVFADMSLKQLLEEETDDEIEN